MWLMLSTILVTYPTGSNGPSWGWNPGRLWSKTDQKTASNFWALKINVRSLLSSVATVDPRSALRSRAWTQSITNTENTWNSSWCTCEKPIQQMAGKSIPMSNKAQIATSYYVACKNFRMAHTQLRILSLVSLRNSWCWFSFCCFHSFGGSNATLCRYHVIIFKY